MSSRRRQGTSALGMLTSGEQPTASTKPGGVYHNLLNQIEAIDPALANRAVVQDDGALQLDSFRITPIGLVGGEQASESEWRTIGKTLFRLHDSLQIILGDWLTQGERIHGKTYEEIADEFGRKRKTLYNWKYVMSSVDISLRRENLSYKHYMIVAPMDYDKQALWLGKASENKWGASKMQDAINDANPPELPDAPSLSFSSQVMDKRALFVARSERITRALDGKDNLDEQTMWECIVDIEKFVLELRKNFGWDKEL